MAKVNRQILTRLVVDRNRTNVLVRPATSRDADAISALAITTFPLGCPPGTDPHDIAAHAARELTPERFRAYIADPQATALVAHVGDGHFGSVLAGYAI